MMVRLWEVASGKEICQLKGYQQTVTSVAFSPDGKVLASASGNEIRMWDAGSGVEIRRLMSEASSLVCFSQDGTILASTTRNGREDVRCWEVASGKEIRRCCGERGEVIGPRVFSADGKRFASVGYCESYSGPYYAKPICIWDVTTGRQMCELQGHQQGSLVKTLAFSLDGKMLASAVSDEIRLWDTGSGKEIRRLHRHQGEILGIAFSPDGKTLASAGENETLLLWGLDE